MRLPIFQLTWDYNSDGKLGLMFPSELGYDVQSFTFAIPVPVSFINDRPEYDQIDDILRSTNYFFPSEIRKEYVELEGEITMSPESKIISEDIITFNIGSSQVVRFRIDIFSTRAFYRKQGIRVKYINRYVGKYNIPSNLIFIPIIPLDLNLMDELYNENQVVLVGYTPNFGKPYF